MGKSPCGSNSEIAEHSSEDRHSCCWPRPKPSSLCGSAFALPSDTLRCAAALLRLACVSDIRGSADIFANVAGVIEGRMADHMKMLDRAARQYDSVFGLESGLFVGDLCNRSRTRVRSSGWTAFRTFQAGGPLLDRNPESRNIPRTSTGYPWRDSRPKCLCELSFPLPPDRPHFAATLPRPACVR